MKRLQATVNPPMMSQSRHVLLNQSREHYSKRTADLFKLWTNPHQEPTASVEVCNLVIRSRLPGRHRAEARLVLALSQQSSLQSFISITARQRQRVMWGVCVMCLCALCCTTVSFACSAEYKNCTLQSTSQVPAFHHVDYFAARFDYEFKTWWLNLNVYPHL